MLLYYFHESGFNGVLFSISVAAVWEILEAFLKEGFDSYVLYGDSLVGEPETACNISIMDLGNGLLGGLLAFVTFKGEIREDFTYWKHIGIFIILALVYAFFSGISWYCSWSSECDSEEMVDFPWGNLFNIILLSLYIYFCFTNGFWIWINVIIISIVGSIPYLSSAYMVYIATIICFLIQAFRNDEIKKVLKRVSRKEYVIRR